MAKAVLAGPRLAAKAAAEAPQSKREGVEAAITVSYTHLTLPTKRIV